MLLAAMGEAQKDGQAVGMCQGFEYAGEFIYIHKSKCIYVFSQKQARNQRPAAGWPNENA